MANGVQSPAPVLTGAGKLGGRELVVARARYPAIYARSRRQDPSPDRARRSRQPRRLRTPRRRSWRGRQGWTPARRPAPRRATAAGPGRSRIRTPMPRRQPRLRRRRPRSPVRSPHTTGIRATRRSRRSNIARWTMASVRVFVGTWAARVVRFQSTTRSAATGVGLASRKSTDIKTRTEVPNDACATARVRRVPRASRGFVMEASSAGEVHHQGPMPATVGASSDSDMRRGASPALGARRREPSSAPPCARGAVIGSLGAWRAGSAELVEREVAGPA